MRRFPWPLRAPTHRELDYRRDMLERFHEDIAEALNELHKRLSVLEEKK